MKKILFTLLCALLAAPAFAGAPDDSTLSVRLYFEGGQHGRLIPSEATTTLKTFFSDTSLNIKQHGPLQMGRKSGITVLPPLAPTPQRHY